MRLARQRALEEAAARLGELVVDVVERIIGREIDAEAHRDLIDEAVDALSGDESGTRRLRGGGGDQAVNPRLEGYAAAVLEAVGRPARRRAWPPTWRRSTTSSPPTRRCGWR